MGKKNFLAHLLFQSHGYRFFHWLGGCFPGSVLKILAYHRVCDVDELNDPELVSANCDEFDWQMSHISRNYCAMTFEAVINCLQRGRQLPKNAIVVTFDDGFADNYRNAFKILMRHRVPATFFLASDYVGSGKTFWFNRLSRIVMSNPGKDLSLDGQKFHIGIHLNDRRMLVERLLHRCKQVSDSRRRAFIDHIASELGEGGECDYLAQPLTWEEIREMSDCGMEFGSHTRSHPVLSRVAVADLAAEIEESKRAIEAKIGKTVQVFSYPDGGADAVNDEVLKAVKEAGYLLATSYIPGSNRNIGIGDFMLRRIHVERYTDRARFASALVMPRIMA